MFFQYCFPEQELSGLPNKQSHGISLPFSESVFAYSKCPRSSDTNISYLKFIMGSLLFDRFPQVFVHSCFAVLFIVQHFVFLLGFKTLRGITLHCSVTRH